MKHIKLLLIVQRLDLEGFNVWVHKGFKRCLESFDIFSRVATFCEARQSTSNLISMFSSPDFEISSRFGINVFESVYEKFKNFIDFSRLEFQDSTFKFGLVKGIQRDCFEVGVRKI